MPPVAIGAAIAAGATAAFVGATLSTAVAIASVAFSVMAAITAKVPTFDGYTSAQERKQVIRSAAASKLIVYGEVMGSGVLFFAEEQAGEQSDGELLHMCIAVAGHPLSSIGQIYLNDEPIESYGEYATYEFHNNRQTVDPYLKANCPSWQDDMIGKGIAFIRFTFKFNAEKFPTSIPNIKLIKRGFVVTDPRDGQQKFSSNSALVYLHFLKTFCGVKDSDTLIDQFKDSANISDELVQTASGTSVRYRTNGEFDISESRIKVLEAMLDACAGSRVYTGGKHGLMVGAYNGPAVLELHSRQVCGDMRITPETSERDRFNTYKGTFVNAKQGYTECDFPQVSVPAWVTEDGGVVSKDINFRFVTDEYQAQRIASIRLNRARKGRILSVPLNYSGFTYRPGLNVKVFIPELGINGVEFRIDSWGFSVTNAVTVVMIQDDASMYGDIIGSAVGVPPLTTLPTEGPAAPDNFIYTAQPVGDVIQGKLTWTNRGSQVVDNVVTVLRNGVVQFMANAPGQELPVNGLTVGNYEARIFSVALNGSRSPTVTLAFTIAVPSVPTSVATILDNWSIQLIPKFTEQLAFGTICEFYTSTKDIPLNEVETKAFYLGMGTTLMHSGLQPDTTYYYWIRSVNAYGKSAFFAMSAKTTYDVDSILDAMDGQIGAEHLREELRTEIEKIPDLEDGYNEVKNTTQGLSQVISGVQSSYYESADAALEAATANSEGDHKTRKSFAQATREIKTVADVTQALGKIVDQTRAELGENIAATQTVAASVVKLDGEVRASWYTKAQVNGVGGGFGLEVVMNQDGSALTSMVVDADVFAVLSREVGATSVRHPFIVKNGTVYMNHVMMDTAEIGTVIAKYINVTQLNAVTITASTISGSTINASVLNSSTLNSSTINGGSLSIANRFLVDSNGNVTIRNAPNGVGMSLSNDIIDVRDSNNVLRVRIGRLS